MDVTVCALTYKRQEGLRRLLRGLDTLTFRSAPPDIRIVVVDNDAQGTAQPMCEQLASTLRWPLEYAAEARPGLAIARNTALSHARDSQWICFIDDDEVPEPTWLDELLHTQQAYGADVVGGPVVPDLPDETPDWVLRGRFLDYNRHLTGTELPYVFTNNVLFRSSILDNLPLWFDERYNQTGGEDRHFFQRIGMAGYRIVWSDEAVVREWVPAERVTARWILQRSYRYGNTTSNVELDLRPGMRTRLMLPILAAYRLLKGTCLLPFSWPLGRHKTMACLQQICHGAGMLAGWVGGRYREYRRLDAE